MSSEKNIDLYRRRFLGGAATAAAGIALAPGVILHEIAHAKPAEEAVTSKVRWGMLIDSNKCAEGCDDCVKACNEEHGLHGFDRPATDAQWIRKVKLKDKQTGFTQTLPMLCQHCETPPCVDVCPTGASFRRADGIVLVDKHICIGCRYCMMACPYKARSFIHETLHDQKPHSPRGKGTVESCNFCVYRVDNGETPACVEACTAENHNAMVFGDLNDPSSDISKQLKQHNTRQIRPDLELNTGVRYRGI
jgi:molybdopterin-containing oxidoreductase family iron-sulfur binding subunit